MFKFERNRSYMMPAHFGPRDTGGKATGWYRDVTVVAVSYLTDRGKLASYLPEPFEVGEEPLVTVVYARNRNVDWLAGHGYNLVGVHASAVFKGEHDRLDGSFCLVMWENLADPILTGRELQGVPKIYADIPDQEVLGDAWHGSASHFGHKILDMSVSNLRAPTAEEIAAFQQGQEGKDNPMGWRYLPGVGGFGTTVSEPTTFPSESVITDAWVGAGRVEWHRLTWEQNPTQFHIVNALADLPILEYRPAIVSKGSVNLAVPDRWPRALR
jgi:acetoacetate decarboxylase